MNSRDFRPADVDAASEELLEARLSGRRAPRQIPLVDMYDMDLEDPCPILFDEAPPRPEHLRLSERRAYWEKEDWLSGRTPTPQGWDFV
jgi:hypothetical protein